MTMRWWEPCWGIWDCRTRRPRLGGFELSHLQPFPSPPGAPPFFVGAPPPPMRPSPRDRGWWWRPPDCWERW